MNKILSVVFWMNVQASFFILAILLFRQCLKRVPRSYSRVLWILVLLRLLCPVFLEGSVSLIPDFKGEVSRPPVIREESHKTGTGPIISNEEANAREPEKNEPQATKGVPWAIKGIMGGVWLLGAFLVLACQTGRYLAVKRKVRLAVFAGDNVWECGEAAAPFVIGFWRPRIYLPFGVAGAERDYILAHERLHIRRFDPQLRMLGALACCIHWWNPLIWTAVRFLDLDIEMACDEEVLKNAGMAERKAYSRLLLSCAQSRSGRPGILSFGRSNVENRIRHILSYHRPGRFAGVVLSVIIIICAAGCLTVPAEREKSISLESSSRTEEPEKKESAPPVGEPGVIGVLKALPEDSYRSAVDMTTEDFQGFPPESGLSILARSREKRITIYGYSDPEAGSKGMILDWNGARGYFDYDWFSTYGDREVYVSDYDGDGREEAAFHFLWGAGTGGYKERLILFEAGRDGVLVPYEFTEEAWLEEVKRLVDEQVDEEGQRILLVSASDHEKVIQERFYEDAQEEGKAIRASGVDYAQQVRFEAGAQLKLCLEPLDILEHWESGHSTGQQLVFQIMYRDSQGKARFTLTDVTSRDALLYENARSFANYYFSGRLNEEEGARLLAPGVKLENSSDIADRITHMEIKTEDASRASRNKAGVSVEFQLEGDDFYQYLTLEMKYNRKQALWQVASYGLEL